MSKWLLSTLELHRNPPNDGFLSDMPAKVSKLKPCTWSCYMSHRPGRLSSILITGHSEQGSSHPYLIKDLLNHNTAAGIMVWPWSWDTRSAGNSFVNSLLQGTRESQPNKTEAEESNSKAAFFRTGFLKYKWMVALRSSALHASLYEGSLRWK